MDFLQQAGTYFANFDHGMNWNDLIIIYLACGAPFAVYYYLQNRNLNEKNYLYLKTLFRFLVWIPDAFRLVAA